MTFKILCPHCKHEAPSGDRSALINNPGPRVLLCSVDDGGCDRYFVAEVHTRVEHTVLVGALQLAIQKPD